MRIHICINAQCRETHNAHLPILLLKINLIPTQTPIEFARERCTFSLHRDVNFHIFVVHTIISESHEPTAAESEQQQQKTSHIKMASRPFPTKKNRYDLHRVQVSKENLARRRRK